MKRAALARIGHEAHRGHGAAHAVRLVDEALHGSDALATSLVLAKALGTLEYDLVVTGMASTDGTMSVVPAMLSERLGVAGLTLAGSLAIEDGTVTIRRDSDDASTTITGSLPRPSWYTENLQLKSFLDAMVISQTALVLDIVRTKKLPTMFMLPETEPADLPPMSMQVHQLPGMVRSLQKLARPIDSIASSGSLM
mgnify:CR=1 FL=1